MGYLVCEKCGKYYELPEGKASFSFSKCSECGGRLRYADSLNEIAMMKSSNGIAPILKPSTKKCPKCGLENPKGAVFCLNCGENLHVPPVETFNFGKPEKKEENASWGLSLLGVLVGFTFLVTSLVFAVLALFGTKIPHTPAEVSTTMLVAFGSVAMVIMVISGLITSYIGGSRNYRDGILNSGILGVILSLPVGAMGGAYTFLVAIGFFWVLTTLGGIIGTFLRKHSD